MKIDFDYDMDDLLDIKSIRYDAEIEESFCKDCVFAEECTNKECIKLEDLHVQ